MSAGSIPYHLRPNKAVDRLLFLELCSKLDTSLHFEKNKYEYIGFGGPQMEDFRLLHERFPKLPMLCIEKLESVITRQKFNCPNTQVKFLAEAKQSSVWLEEWEPTLPVILWFDYAIKNERNDQFNEYQSILAKAPLGSVIRITMNAELPFSPEKGAEKQRQSLEAKFKKIMPPKVSDEELVPGEFPELLAKMFRLATEGVLSPANEKIFAPLLLTDYQDSNRMFTMAGVITEKNLIEDILVKARLKTWEYFSDGWNRLRRINMPELTLKERIYINQLLPDGAADPRKIQAALGFNVDELEITSLAKISNYTEFYRHFPQFGRVAI